MILGVIARLSPVLGFVPEVRRDRPRTLLSGQALLIIR
jgi:hypothetical protein